jgi:lipoprotein-anchoring transpeptidase ErfK/SrfK
MNPSKPSGVPDLRFTGIFLVVYILFFVTALIAPVAHNPKEPLADEQSLTTLIAGGALPKPNEEKYAEFHGISARPPGLSSLETIRRVLGFTTETRNKRIEIDLTNQKLYAFEGDRKVYDFSVSTGKWWPTPTGEFTIWVKVKSQLMKGGSRELGTYYYLPNVPFVMFFYNQSITKIRGFGIHGAYWHNNFGHPMSHGCINMKIEDSKALYEWATPVVTNPKAWSTLATPENTGTKVTIYGVTPAD